jgi:hypothetical protein
MNSLELKYYLQLVEAIAISAEWSTEANRYWWTNLPLFSYTSLEPATLSGGAMNLIQRVRGWSANFRFVCTLYLTGRGVVTEGLEQVEKMHRASVVQMTMLSI